MTYCCKTLHKFGWIVCQQSHKITNQPCWFTTKIRNAPKKNRELYSAAKICNFATRFKLVRKQIRKLIKYAKQSYFK